MIEQELASIITFVLASAGSPSPYYWKVPENFNIPAVYFPTPEITTGGETFLTYRMEYTWFIKFFAIDDNQAYAMALQALTAIKGNHDRVPLINSDGDVIKGEWVRVQDPKMKVLDNDTAQLQLDWVSRRPYDDVLAEKTAASTFDLNVYFSKHLDNELAEALAAYSVEYPASNYQQPESE